ncbi:hypothetical protein [Fundidesulfovibrio putealis]|uniref:hypothetical protein n=1 Tax=Fundidesulfovibrio putealis TaxID=270496 RepID=UPI0012EB5F20|nr:hypothetical protein [Fundidesulfovibrio putealis]
MEIGAVTSLAAVRLALRVRLDGANVSAETAKVAKAISVSEHIVSEICSGSLDPSLDLQEKIAEHYGMPLATFIADGHDRMVKRHGWKYVTPSNATGLSKAETLTHAVESAESKFGIDEYLGARSELVQLGVDGGMSEETIHALSMAICEEFVRRVALKNGM